jgi:group I intron endonuclease
MGYIYKITNKVTGKHYIGVTREKEVETRWKRHIYSINEGKGCPLLAKSIKKHGIDNFSFEVLIICFDEDVYLYEPQYIKKYNSLVPSGYNATEGGMGGGFKGKKYSPESIKKFSDATKKYYENNPEARKRSSDTVNKYREKINIGIRAAAEKRRYESILNNKRESHSDERKEKIRQSVLKYYNSLSEDKIKSNKEKCSERMSKVHGVKIAQYDLNNNLIKTYDTIKNAAIETGINKVNISASKKNINNISCGFIWKRIEA